MSKLSKEYKQQKLKAYCKEVGSMRDLAKTLSISYDTLASWSCGRTEIPNMKFLYIETYIQFNRKNKD